MRKRPRDVFIPFHVILPGSSACGCVLVENISIINRNNKHFYLFTMAKRADNLVLLRHLVEIVILIFIASIQKLCIVLAGRARHKS